MSAAELTTEEAAALGDALDAERAAVYGYGVVAAYAAPQRTGAVDDAAAAHRGRRDDLVTRLAAQGAPVPAGEAAYDVGPVADATAAAALAARLEEATAVTWRAVLERSEPGDLRRTALAALVDAATRASSWRVALEQPALRPFPGQP